MRNFVENKLVEDPGSVWLLDGHENFGYSDGVESERYLKNVFEQAKDLSTRSHELETYIKDWPSEYHLTTKRAQLLSGFNFDRSMRVLEVGCGCGAITRHLGENFDQVVSVEGNLNRARLARMRTSDLSSVSVICAPFQEIKFKQKFDIIFCVGVYEYSGSFVDGDDPYDNVLKYFSEMLSPDGKLVIAIENQFGLKYFSGLREDHLGVKYDGLEGYHRSDMNVRTFGRTELKDNVQKYFKKVDFYYPYPDYKIPECVLSSDFVDTGEAGEIVSQITARDYSGPTEPIFDQATAALELSRNKMLGFFSNSLILVAGRESLDGICFGQDAVIYTSGRRPKFSAMTLISKDQEGARTVEKRLWSGKDSSEEGALSIDPATTSWINGNSLQTELLTRARLRNASLDSIFRIAQPWLTFLESEATEHGGKKYVSGRHIDSIWKNSYCSDGKCQLIDREWIWRDDVALNTLLIRAIYDFLSKLDNEKFLPKCLQARSGQKLIYNIASTFGVKLSAADFSEFFDLEAELQHLVFGVDKKKQRAFLYWYMFDRNGVRNFRSIKTKAANLSQRVANKLRIGT